jgi:hypothetical protein
MKNVDVFEWGANTIIQGDNVEISFRMNDFGEVKEFGVRLKEDNHRTRLFSEDEFKEFVDLMATLAGERLRKTVNVIRQSKLNKK